MVALANHHIDLVHPSYIAHRYKPDI
jgi:hypothetical protein